MDQREEEDINESKTLLYIYGAIAILLVVLIWYFLWYYLDHCVKSSSTELSDPEFQGLFGDKFGFVNSLFSALAFAGIIFTIILQGKELELQRKELKRTKQVFKDQHITMGIQRFESTFFNLVELVNSTRESITYKPGNTLFVGHEAIDDMVRLLTSQYDTHLTNVTRMRKTSVSGILKDDLIIYKEIFKAIYEHDKGKLSSFFKIVFRVLQFLDDDEDLIEEEKKKYGDIFFSFFSENELKYILYYVTLTEGQEKFNYLVNCYFDYTTIDLEFAKFDKKLIPALKIKVDPSS